MEAVHKNMKGLDHNSTKNIEFEVVVFFSSVNLKKNNVINTFKQVVCVRGSCFMPNLDFLQNRVHSECPKFDLKNLTFKNFPKKTDCTDWKRKV